MRNYQNLNYKIFDFHIHPFISLDTCISLHNDYINTSLEQTEKDLRALGVVKACGSVIEGVELKRKNDAKPFTFDRLRALNDEALLLKEKYGDFYVPGFHVHPDFVKESISEVERMGKAGVNVIGELVPYHHGWQDYSCKGMMEILDCAEQYGMIVSFHTMGCDDVTCKQMDDMVASHPQIKFVGAHPNEQKTFNDHVRRLKNNENYYLDTSGGGISRYGTLRHLIDDVGLSRILFGSDYPICNPCMHVGGVALDYLLTEDEKKAVFYDNACKLFNIEN